MTEEIRTQNAVADLANQISKMNESLAAIRAQTAPPPVKTLSEMSPAEFNRAMDAYERDGTPLPPMGGSVAREIFVHPEILARQQRERENREWCDEMDRLEAERRAQTAEHAGLRARQRDELESHASRLGMKIGDVTELPHPSARRVTYSPEQLDRMSPAEFEKAMDAMDAARRR